MFHMELSREEIEQLKGAASILTQIEQHCSSAGSRSSSSMRARLGPNISSTTSTTASTDRAESHECIFRLSLVLGAHACGGDGEA